MTRLLSRKRLALCALAMLLIPAAGVSAPLTEDAINQATFQSEKMQGGADPSIIKLEVLLDRAGFSPGVIDGRDGENFQKALRAYREANGLSPTDDAISRLSQADTRAVVTTYAITAQDVKGPFLKELPTGFDKLAKLPALSYASAKEELAERFHMDEKLLSDINSETSFAKEGDRILVANVPSRKIDGKVVKIDIDKAGRTVRAFDGKGRLLAFYPASIGSEEKPAPTGSFKVRVAQRDPIYHYNPDFAFKGVKSRKPLTIKAGPNNPVGAMWIDLSAPSYGIHGTPNPEKVSKTESHGCVRLTNWDVLQLGSIVAKGAAVNFLN